MSPVSGKENRGGPDEDTIAAGSRFNFALDRQNQQSFGDPKVTLPLPPHRARRRGVVLPFSLAK
jgi:hypothetical protein